MGPIMEDNINLLEKQKPALYAIDAHSANAKRRTGVHNYAFHLIQAMKNHPLQEGERVVLYSYEPLNEDLAKLPEGWTSKVLKWPPRHGWMSIRVRWELFKDKPSVFFVPAQAIPKTSVPTVITKHDIGWKFIPEVFEPADIKRLKRDTKKAVRDATHILAVSEATKKDLIDQFHIEPERVSTTVLAADTMMYHVVSEEEKQRVLQTYRIGKRFFLTVGRLETKKNIATIIRAFDVFKSHRGSGDPYELVLVGKPGYGYEQIKSYIDASPYKDQIRELGFVPDIDVVPLMNLASAYLFPSWFEGFGIPNLEAMACGTPLLTSDLPAHREVVGDAGVFIDPKDPDAWAREMADVIDDEVKRKRLIENGFKRVQEFSWDKCALQTWEVLRSLL